MNWKKGKNKTYSKVNEGLNACNVIWSTFEVPWRKTSFESSGVPTDIVTLSGDKSTQIYWTILNIE